MSQNRFRDLNFCLKYLDFPIKGKRWSKSQTQTTVVKTKGYMASWKTLIVVALVSVLFLFYSPTLLDINPEAYSIPFPVFAGPLEVNNLLSKTEHLFKGSIHGPESIVIYKGDLYTGTEDGWIVKISGNELVPVVRIGRECSMPWEERQCGRPLGLRMGKDGLLYIVDAYYGLHSVNVTAGTLTRLLPTNVEIEGKKLTFPDDMDLDDNGNIYISDASTKWDLSEIYYLVAEYDGTGRVIKFNINSGKVEVLLRNLHFPNGVQLSHDRKSLLICENSQRRIIRYHIKGPKQGQQDIFVDKLPGEPDNIRLSERGGYWVAFSFARNSTHKLFIDHFNEFPWIKKVWARTEHGLGSLLMGLSELWPSSVFKEFAYRIKRGDILLNFLNQHGIIMELDNEGNILRTFQSPDGKTSYLSQVTEHKGYLYLGSFANNYLGRLKL